MSANGAASPGRWHDVQLLNTIGAMCSVNVSLAGALLISPAEKAAEANAQAPADIVQNRFIISLLPVEYNSRWPWFQGSRPAYRSGPHPAPCADRVPWRRAGACPARRRRYRYGRDRAPDRMGR